VTDTDRKTLREWAEAHAAHGSVQGQQTMALLTQLGELEGALAATRVALEIARRRLRELEEANQVLRGDPG
jgi:hypothetical protein